MDGTESSRQAGMAIRWLPDEMQGKPKPIAARLIHKESFSENYHILNLLIISSKSEAIWLKICAVEASSSDYDLI